jgi:hypothetical protein
MMARDDQFRIKTSCCPGRISVPTVGHQDIDPLVFSNVIDPSKILVVGLIPCLAEGKAFRRDDKGDIVQYPEALMTGVNGDREFSFALLNF